MYQVSVKLKLYKYMYIEVHWYKCMHARDREALLQGNSQDLENKC